MDKIKESEFKYPENHVNSVKKPEENGFFKILRWERGGTSIKDMDG
jgi:hypothetical protein